jgi:hypothetical protein
MESIGLTTFFQGEMRHKMKSKLIPLVRVEVNGLSLLYDGNKPNPRLARYLKQQGYRLRHGTGSPRAGAGEQFDAEPKSTDNTEGNR